MTTVIDTDCQTRNGPRVVILQPCFFPWRGQFDLYSRADVRIFLDDVQFSRGTWFNRNKIMTASGPAWITVPIRKQGILHTLIKDMPITGGNRWQDKMLGQIHAAYRKAPFFAAYWGSLEDLIRRDWTHIADLSMASVRWCFDILGRSMDFLVSSHLAVDATDPVDRLVRLCQKVSGRQYLSGPAAKTYIGEGRPFRDAGIELQWMSYPAYLPYRDEDGEEMSIIDLIFLKGPQASRYIWKESQ
jgi:hypothetical protein